MSHFLPLSVFTDYIANEDCSLHAYACSACDRVPACLLYAAAVGSSLSSKALLPTLINYKHTHSLTHIPPESTGERRAAGKENKNISLTEKREPASSKVRKKICERLRVCVFKLVWLVGCSESPSSCVISNKDGRMHKDERKNLFFIYIFFAQMHALARRCCFRKQSGVWREHTWFTEAAFMCDYSLSVHGGRVCAPLQRSGRASFICQMSPLTECAGEVHKWAAIFWVEWNKRRWEARWQMVNIPELDELKLKPFHCMKSALQYFDNHCSMLEN